MSSSPWPVARLGDLATVQGGIQIGREPRAGATEVPYLRVANVKDGYIDSSEIRSVLADQAEVARYRLRAGDVLFTEGGDFDKLGRGCVWDGSIDPCLHQNHVFAVRPDPSALLPEFLAAIASSAHGRHYFIGASKQSTNLASVSSSQLKAFPVPLPPLPEQRRIAEILRTWDDAIDTAIQGALSRQRTHDRVRSDLYRRRYPGSTEATFGELLSESRNPGTNGATATKLSVRLYGKGAIAKESQRAGSANTKYFRRAAGQLVYSRLDFLNGAFAILQPQLDGLESTLDLPAFDILSSTNPEWLLNYLTRKEYYSAQTHVARGQRKARRVAPQDFLRERIILPPREQQDQIAGVLLNSAEAIQLSQRRVELLRTQKRGLLQKLLSGDVRVPTGDGGVA